MVSKSVTARLSSLKCDADDGGRVALRKVIPLLSDSLATSIMGGRVDDASIVLNKPICS